MIVNISITSSQKVQCINISEKLDEVASELQLTEGILFIYVPHTTCALTINECCDPDVFQDIIEKLDHIIPQSFNYHHCEGNSEAHIKSAIIGNQRFVFVHNSKIVKGSWEGIYLMEFDGPRNRRILVNAIKTS